MRELNCDHWSLLLPVEWFAEQDEESVVITDEDEASIIEITPLFSESGDTGLLMAQFRESADRERKLAGLPALYHETVDDGMFWREWYCDAGDFVLAISHGCDEANKGMDDAAVDEILSTLLIGTNDGGDE